MKITKRQIRNIIREEHGSDWGSGADEYKRDDDHKAGDVDGHYKDYEGEEGGNFGDESETDPGHLDYEGGSDVEHKAHTAMAAIHDLASAAGVELNTTVTGTEDAELENLGATMENRRRRSAKLSESQIRRIIREEKRSIRRRLREDSIDDELDNLRKNVSDDLDHIKSLKDDIKDDHEEEIQAEKDRKDETLRREIRKMIRETKLDKRNTRRR